MTERSMPWNGPADGSGTGDANMASYDAHNEWAAFTVTISGAGARANKGGVSFGERSDYDATVVGGAVRVQPGTGICHGQWHDSDANVDVSIPTPASATRVDRIVLRKDWAAQTVRITRIAGTEGAGTPALVQNAGTTWDVPLWNASITTAGTITLINARQGLNSDAEGSLPVAINIGDAGSAGSSGVAADSGHQHAFPDPASAPPAFDFGATAAEGTATTSARSDHTHETPKIFRRMKSADETLGNSTVLQDDNDLTFPVVSGESYVFEGVIFESSPAAADFKLAFNLPASSTIRWGAFGPDPTTPATVIQGNTNGIDTAVTFGSDGNVQCIKFFGSFTAGGNGVCVARWAKDQADASNTTVYKHSTLIAHEV